MLTERDYPVIDITLKFCEYYLSSNRGLVDLQPAKPRDKVVLDWLHELNAAAKTAETAVLIANFRGDDRKRDTSSPGLLCND